MFWYNDDVYSALTRVAKNLSPNEKMEFRKVLKSEGITNIEFNRTDYPKIQNHELQYINCLYVAILDRDVGLENINNALKICNLEFKDSKIYNKNGACSVVTLERMGDRDVIRKRTKDNRDISLEYSILLDLRRASVASADNKRYVINVIPDSYDGESYIMEVAIQNLEGYIKTQRPAVKEKSQLIGKIIDCVNFVHVNHYLHRDLHPGNILFLRGEPEHDMIEAECCVLSDFGFACKISGERKQCDIQKKYYGNRNYTAPEQLKSLADASVKSDIYSVGKLINYIMTGDSSNLTHIFGSIAKKCTYNNPSDRYGSVMDLKRSFDLIVRPFSN